MTTARDIIAALVKVDDRLTAEYGSASPRVRKQIDYIARTIEVLIKELVKIDLRLRTKRLKQLSKEIGGAAEELAALKATIESMVQAGQMAQKTLNALAALIPFL